MPFNEVYYRVNLSINSLPGINTIEFHFIPGYQFVVFEPFFLTAEYQIIFSYNTIIGSIIPFNFNINPFIGGCKYY